MQNVLDCGAYIQITRLNRKDNFSRFFAGENVENGICVCLMRLQGMFTSCSCSQMNGIFGEHGIYNDNGKLFNAAYLHKSSE